MFWFCVSWLSVSPQGRGCIFFRLFCRLGRSSRGTIRLKTASPFLSFPVSYMFWQFSFRSIFFVREWFYVIPVARFKFIRDTWIAVRYCSGNFSLVNHVRYEAFTFSWAFFRLPAVTLSCVAYVVWVVCIRCCCLFFILVQLSFCVWLWMSECMLSRQP